jgi:hypothetical protein
MRPRRRVKTSESRSTPVASTAIFRSLTRPLEGIAKRLVAWRKSHGDAELPPGVAFSTGFEQPQAEEIAQAWVARLLLDCSP